MRDEPRKDPREHAEDLKQQVQVPEEGVDDLDLQEAQQSKVQGGKGFYDWIKT